jgi:class 3 adenylate cyclase
MIKQHPEMAVRMGIQSGPVSEVTDVSGRSDIAGAGINMAQRLHGDPRFEALAEKIVPAREFAKAATPAK